MFLLLLGSLSLMIGLYLHRFDNQLGLFIAFLGFLLLIQYNERLKKKIVELFDPVSSCPKGSIQKTFYLINGNKYNGYPVLMAPEGDDLQTWYIDNQWFQFGLGNRIAEQFLDFIILNLGSMNVGNTLCATIVSGSGQDSNGGQIVAVKDSDQNYSYTLFDNNGNNRGKVSNSASYLYNLNWANLTSSVYFPNISDAMNNKITTVDINQNYGLRFIFNMRSINPNQWMNIIAVSALDDNGNALPNMSINSRIPALYVCPNTTRLVLSLGNNQQPDIVLLNCENPININRDYLFDIVISSDRCYVSINGESKGVFRISLNRFNVGKVGIFNNLFYKFDGTIRDVFFYTSNDPISVQDLTPMGVFRNDTLVYILTSSELTSFKRTDNDFLLGDPIDKKTVTVDKLKNILTKDGKKLGSLIDKDTLQIDNTQFSRFKYYKSKVLSNQMIMRPDGTIYQTVMNRVQIPDFSVGNPKKCRNTFKESPNVPIKQIKGFANNVSVQSVEYVPLSGESLFSGIDESSTQFNIQCPNSQDIVAYRAAVGNNRDGESIFNRIGPVYCKDGTVLGDIFGSGEKIQDSIVGQPAKTGLSDYLYVGEVTYGADGDIGYIKKTTLENCANICSLYNNCGGFSQNNDICNLYTGGQSLKNPIKTPGARSYTKNN